MSTRINTNNRLFYAVAAVGFAATGVTGANFRTASGVQSVGIDTNFNIDRVFQLGQLDIYQNIENIPNVEVTVEKVLDGTALLEHLATPLTGQGPELISRYSNQRCDVAVNFYQDTLSSASGTGTQLNQCFMSGMYVSAINFSLPTDGNFTESISLVGNSKNWRNAASSIPFMPNMSSSAAPPTGAVVRKQHLIFGYNSDSSSSELSYLPKHIPGIDSTGYNREWHSSLGSAYAGYGAHISNIQISTDLGRTELFELGRKGPYHRYIDFPVEVTCSIEITDTEGDAIVAQENSDNTTNQRIFLVIADGTRIDLGSSNKLVSVSSSGGDTGGGNRTVSYNYSNFNKLTVTRIPSSLDPAGAEDAQSFSFS